MGVYKRGRIWSFSYMAGGKQVRESSHSTNKRFAEQVLAKRKTEVLEGRWGLPRASSPRLHEWAEEFISTIGNASTKSRYGASKKHLSAFFGNPRLGEITVEQIVRFQQQRVSSGVGPATVNRDVAFLARLLRLAHRRRVTVSNPCDQIEKLNERRSRRQARPLSYEEEERLLVHCSPQLRALAILLIETGLRPRREALSLMWSDIDLSSQPASLIVRASKTSRGERRVWLTEYCRSAMSKWKKSCPSQVWVFPAPRSPERHWGSYQDAWERAAQRAGLGNRRTYDLRSTFATRASAAASVTDLALAHLLGHSSTAILPTYAKPLDANTREIIQQLDAHRMGHRSADQPVQ